MNLPVRGAKLALPIQSVYGFGFFVELPNNLEGFVHTTQISRNPAKQTTEGLDPGQIVTLWVLDANPETRRVALTMIDPAGPSMVHLRPAQKLSGTVVRVEDSLGAFVDIGVEREGLVHISEMSKTRVQRASDVVQVGQTVTVWVKSVDLRESRISLSLMPPPSRSLGDLRPGQRLAGTVVRVEGSLGAFVDVDAEREGLVHISELSRLHVQDASDVVHVGQAVTVWVKGVDRQAGRLSLSMVPPPSRRVEDLYPGMVLDGIVAGFHASSQGGHDGAFVDVDADRDGWLHISELSAGSYVTSASRVLTVGQSVRVRVLQVDPTSRKFSLTMKGV